MSVDTYNVRATPNLRSKPCWDLFIPFARDILGRLEVLRTEGSPAVQQFEADINKLRTLTFFKDDDIRSKFNKPNLMPTIIGYPGLAQMGAVLSQYVTKWPELQYHMDLLWESFEIEDALVFFLIQEGETTAGQIIKRCQKAAKRVKLPNSLPWKVESDSLTEDYVTNVIGSHPSQKFQSNLKKFATQLDRMGNGPWSDAELSAFNKGYDNAMFALLESDADAMYEGAINAIVKLVNEAGKKEGRTKPRNTNAIRHRLYETKCRESEVGKKLLAVANKLCHPEANEMELTVLAPTPPKTQKAILQDVRETFDKVTADQGLTVDQKHNLAFVMAPSILVACEESAPKDSPNMTLDEALQVWMTPTMDTTPLPPKKTESLKGNTTLDDAIRNWSGLDSTFLPPKAVRQVINAPIAALAKDYFIPEERPLAPSVIEELKAKADDPDYWVPVPVSRVTDPTVVAEMKALVEGDNDYRISVKHDVPSSHVVPQTAAYPKPIPYPTTSPKYRAPEKEEPKVTAKAPEEQESWAGEPAEKTAFFDSIRELTFYYRKLLKDNGLSEFGEHGIRANNLLFNKGNFFYVESSLNADPGPEKKPIYVDFMNPYEVTSFFQGLPGFDRTFTLFIKANSRHKAWANASLSINAFLLSKKGK